MMLVLLVLCSGFFQCTLANRLRVFHFNGSDSRANRSDALEWCKMRSMSLVTLYDETDATFTSSFGENYTGWLGLYKHQHNFSSWSNHETVIFNPLNVTSSNKTDYQTCGAIVNETWTNKNCSERLAFMCYKGNSSYIVSYELIENQKNWCEARQFCRRHYTDLVSISSSEQNTEVITKGKGRTFWIGLIHDRWKWEDNSCSTYRNWAKERPSSPGRPEGSATSQARGSTKIDKIADHEEKSTICSKGTVRIIRSSFPLTWEEAFDYCNSEYGGLLWIEDQEDQDAVKQWLQHKQSKEFFWIGLRQSRVFGFWIWMSDRMVSYSNWRDGTHPKKPLSSQCGAISGQTFEWTDKNCLLRLPFLCEEEISFMNP